MSNPIIPKTNATPGGGAPGSLLLGELASNRSDGKIYLGTDTGVDCVGEKVTSIARGGTSATSSLGALAALGAAPLVSPAFSGTPTVPTASVGTSTTQAASTAFVQANRGDRYLTTSTTSWTLSNGTQAFTVDAGLSYTPTQDVTVVYDINNHAHGTVVSYSGTTLTVDFTQHTGSGTYSEWTINVGGLSVQEGALLQANNLSDVADAATALTNLGGRAETSVVPVLYGGTGSTTAQAALNTLAGAVTAGQVLAGDGSNVTLRALTVADVPTASQLGAFTTSQIIGIDNGGTGATTASAALAALGGQAALTTAAPLAIELGGTAVSDLTSARNAFAPYGIIYVAGRSSSTLTGTVNNYVFTASTNGALPAGDGYAFQNGDLMLSIGSIAGTSANVGPWVVTSVGSASTPVVLTRPSWFQGTINSVGFYFYIRYGTTIQGTIQVVRVSSISGTVDQSIILQNTGQVGATVFSNLGSIINASGASFSGTVVFRPNSTTAHAARFQAGSLQTIASAHAMEWDGQRMYLTNISTQRFAVAYTSDIPALSTVAAAALATAAAIGISSQAARADHVHPLPLGSSTPAALADTATAGTSTEAARADHAHAVPIPAINSTALTSYTPALTDANDCVRFTASTAVAVTAPADSAVAFAVGTQLLLLQSGTGQITVSAGAGATLQSSGGKTKSAAQHSLLTLLKIAANTWVLGGDITT